MSYVSKSAVAQKGRVLAEGFQFLSSGEGFGCFSGPWGSCSSLNSWYWWHWWGHRLGSISLPSWLLMSLSRAAPRGALWSCLSLAYVTAATLHEPKARLQPETLRSDFCPVTEAEKSGAPSACRSSEGKGLWPLTCDLVSLIGIQLVYRRFNRFYRICQHSYLITTSCSCWWEQGKENKRPLQRSTRGNFCCMLSS